MHSIHTIAGHKVNQQDFKTAVINIEDDTPSSIPDTINVNNPTFVQVNDVESGKAEVTQLGVDTGIVDPQPSSSQYIDSPMSPQVTNEDETLQRTQYNAFQDKIMEFKGKLKHCLSSTALLEEENKTFRKELLEWIGRWKEMRAKKNQYKKSKKSIIGTNQLLLKRI